MKWFIYKTPKLQGDKPVMTLNYPPNDFIIEQYAMKFGPIVVISDEEERAKNNA